MTKVSVRPSGFPSVGDLVVLEDEHAHTSVTIAPARGALVTSFRVGARELLYMDESTLTDASKNVRGGVPVLFPSPGKLENDAWQRDGKRGSMKQHGFARNEVWSVEKTSTEPATAVLGLSSTDGTRAQYPWDFHTEFAFTLAGACLRIEQTIANTGSTPMPYGVGFHPYFRTKDKARTRIDTRATRVFDNVTKETRSFTGFDLTLPEVDLHLVDHGSSTSALHFEDGARLDVHASAEYSRWVVWTLAGKDFVCLEPWTCPGNALNTGESLILLSPGASQTSWIELAFTQ